MEIEQEISTDTLEADRIFYFQLVYEGFQRAVRKVGGYIDHFYCIGDYTVCLRFAGEGLLPHLTPAFAHLATNSTAEPALTICLWDSTTTQARMPLLLSSLIELMRSKFWEYLNTRREIKNYDGERIRTTFHIGPNILNVLDTKQNLAVYWVEDANCIPYYERGSPLSALLSLWMGARQRYFVHAGAVGTATGGVLLTGKGGSGKSTSALACLDSELIYASDDYCLTTDHPAPYVYSLYNTAKLKGKADLERFPHLTPMISNLERVGEEKAMIYLQEHFPEKIAVGLPIRAVLMPKVTGRRDTRLQKSIPIAALKALAPSTLFQLAGSGQTTLQAMSNLVRQLPCYTLEVGTEISQIPLVIARLLAES